MFKKSLPFLIAIAVLAIFTWRAIKTTDASNNPLILMIFFAVLIALVFVWDVITRKK